MKKGAVLPSLFYMRLGLFECSAGGAHSDDQIVSFLLKVLLYFTFIVTFAVLYEDAL